MDGQKLFELALVRFEYYEQILEALGDDEIRKLDREESAYQHGGCWEHEQADGGLTFSALSREKQAAILHAIGTNLPARNRRVNKDAGTSYAIKHAVERFVGFYVSNLQAKTAMRILGYKRSDHDLNPYYNISKVEWREFSDRAREIADSRRSAHERMNRQREERACARFFARTTPSR